VTVALTDLIETRTKDEILTTLVGFLRLAGFPATAWQPGSVPRHLVETLASTGADTTALIRDIAKGGFLELAEGDWLTLLAASAYGEDRNAAVYAEGQIVLTDTGGAPYTFAAGDLVVESSAGKRYRNTTGGTLSASGTLTLNVIAESAGSTFNALTGSITSLVTAYPGVTVNNPAIGTTGTWLTTSGTDDETDDALRERCRAKWGSLGSGGSRDAYIYWARKASSQVTRVHVQENYPSDGSVGVFVAGSTVLPTTVVSDVQTYLDTRRPLCVTATAYNCTAVTITLAGTVYYRATASEATVKTGVAAALTALASGRSPASGYVYRSEIIEAVMAVPGVINVALSTPSGDTAFAVGQVPTFSDPSSSFTWTAQ
jgi:uncharacterized phage protein gp47/JayE